MGAEFTPLILAANAIVCLIGIALCLVVMIAHGRLLLLPVGLLVFLVTNGVFQGAQLVVKMDVQYPTAPEMYERALAVHAIVVGLSLLPLLVMARIARPARRITSDIKPLALLLLTAVSLLAVGYFVVRNREAIPLSLSLYSATDYYHYIEIRNAIGDVINGHARSGNAPANWAFGALCPAILALLPSCRSVGRGLRLAWFALVWIAMAAPALLIGSRAMLVFLLAFPVCAWSLGRIDWRHLVRRAISLWKPLVFGLLAGGVVFQMIFRSSLPEAVFGMFSRTMLTPGAVSATYYLAFPDTFPFRGWAGILMMPIGTDTIDFRTVSNVMLELDSNANASFTAIAYSGDGLPGVALATVVLIGVTVLVDLALLGFPAVIANALTIGNLLGALALGSVPLLIALTTHGFALAPAFVLFVLWLLRSCPARRPQVMTARPISLPLTG
ncbi:MAG: hypothetical protein IAE82_05970 [Opitutaceae bacterium]|nr:hypothetical protein [Opitutaceae bacterium]